MERGIKMGSGIADQVESMRQFNRAYELDVQRVLQQARALDLDTYRVRNELQLARDELTLRATLAASSDALGYAQLAQQSWAMEDESLRDWARIEQEANQIEQEANQGE